MLRPALALTAATIAVTGLTAVADRTAPPAVGPATPSFGLVVAAGEPAEAAPRVAAVRPAVERPAVERRAVARPASARPAVAAPASRPARPVVWDGKAFATPEAAMRFLVAAYNARDDRALKHVTTPFARSDLTAMRDHIAPELRLKSCTRLESGAYDCTFTHSTPGSAKHTGDAWFRVAPAARPGWYMTVLEECG